MFNQLFKKQSVLGVDLTSCSVKIIQIEKSAKQNKLLGYAVAAFENNSQGESLKSTEAITSCIKKALAKGNFSSKNVVLAVPDTLVISKTLQFNEGLTDDEIEELVIMEADKFVPYPIEEVNLDFQVINNSTKQTGMVDVIVVASRTTNVGSRTEAILEAGLEPKIVEVESFAVERTLKLLEEDVEGRIITVVDLGLKHTHIYIAEDLKIIFSREEEFGSMQLIKAIMRQRKLSFKKAQEIIEQDNFDEELKKTVLTNFHEKLLLIIKRTLQLFYSTSNYSSLDYVLLAGDIAAQVNIKDYISENLDISVELANPFKNFIIDKKIDKAILKKLAPGFLTACGLALRQK